MPTVVIVGFSYSQEDKLTSTITDIYLLYSFYRDLGYEIYVASDMISAQLPEDIIKLMISQTVDEDFKSFITDDFARIRKLVLDYEDLEKFFLSIPHIHDLRLLFYFTGHGTGDGIKLPDNNVYKSLDLRNSILDIGANRGFPVNIGVNHINAQIMILFDCCNPHGLYLPFKLSRNNVDGGEYYNVTNLYILPKIILISSSEPNALTRAHHSISPFTQNLMNVLKDQLADYSINTVMDKIDENTKEKCSSHASYPSLKIPWTWVVTNVVSVQIDESLDCLVVKRNRLNHLNGK